MRNPWEKWLQRWADAGLIDAATTERIRAFEATTAERQKLRWPVVLAVSLGGLLVGAGVLLFVAAHWDERHPDPAGFEVAAGRTLRRGRRLLLPAGESASLNPSLSGAIASARRLIRFSVG